MATFSIKIPDNSLIPHEFDARQYTSIPEYFHQRDKSSCISIFFLRSIFSHPRETGGERVAG